jgi:hypothetical protein
MKRTRPADAFRGHEDAPLLRIASRYFGIALSGECHSGLIKSNHVCLRIPSAL